MLVRLGFTRQAPKRNEFHFLIHRMLPNRSWVCRQWPCSRRVQGNGRRREIALLGVFGTVRSAEKRGVNCAMLSRIRLTQAVGYPAFVPPTHLTLFAKHI